jgi:hypothetical protein
MDHMIFAVDRVTPKALANYSPGLERQRQPWEPHITVV